MTHAPMLRFLEVIVYSMVNSLPYHFCVLYPFSKKLCFSLRSTLLFLLIPTAVELLLNYLVAFGHLASTGFMNIAWSVGYILAYMLLIRDHPGKIAFLVLVLLNISNFCLTVSKWLEHLYAPGFAMERFHFTSTAALLLVELCVVLPHFITIRRRYTPALRRLSDFFLWRYLWIVPGTFYFLWQYHIHFNSSSSLEVATDPHSIFFLSVITCSSYLIYYIVLRLINESSNNAQLRSYNHQLQLQTLQYENLQERIQETRRINHDLRHHAATMSHYLEAGDLESLQQYFRDLMSSLPSSKPMHYCSHNTLNMLLTYFSQQADFAGIDYRVELQIPATLPIADSDLTVLVGNLLENAVEAASLQTPGNRSVMIRGRVQGPYLLLALDNTYALSPKKDASGVFLSTKHPGQGIGVESAKSIAVKYGGDLTIESDDTVFRVSILLPL